MADFSRIVSGDELDCTLLTLTKRDRLSASASSLAWKKRGPLVQPPDASRLRSFSGIGGLVTNPTTRVEARLWTEIWRFPSRGQRMEPSSCASPAGPDKCRSWIETCAARTHEILASDS